ncbi:hypothetical protein QE152_g5854 [Popillia japonica]|uniref:Retrovirus-related Pol polyprotein from transposon TNT 1-94-like beta-barrel domain-containing protein n=1 Tax=Popillia japonica TaxID=7064 RepID=A0AAW1MKE0_POPJA
MEEDQIGKSEEETVALVSTKFETKCYSWGKKGHMENQLGEEGAYGKPTQEKYGMLLLQKERSPNEGLFPQKQKKRGENKQQKEQRTTTNSNFALVTVSSDIESQLNTDWYLDSGASQHMCRDEKLFKNYKQLDVTKDIKIGDGSVMKAVGIGSIDISAYNGQIFHNVTMCVVH